MSEHHCKAILTVAGHRTSEHDIATYKSLVRALHVRIDESGPWGLHCFRARDVGERLMVG